MRYFKTLRQVGWLHFQVLGVGGQSEKSTSLMLVMGKLFLSYTTHVFVLHPNQGNLNHCSNKIDVKTC